MSSSFIKVLAYADDVAVICSPRTQVRAAVQRIVDFCGVSGEEMNCAKFVGAWLGPRESKPELFLGVTWGPSIPNYLGVSLTTNQVNAAREGEHLPRLNFKALEWRGRYLSLFIQPRFRS